MSASVRRSGGIWIQGAGEIASGIAVRLIRCRYRVILAEISKPLAVRRKVAFSEAVFGGETAVEGISGRLFDTEEARFRSGLATVLVDPEGTALPRVGPAAVVDARLTKGPPAALPGCGSLLIGLGPGFRCGRDTDFIVETHRGGCLGAVISEGEALPNTGIPGVLGGQSSRRVVRAPAAGQLVPCVAIGDLVVTGQVLGHIAGVPVVSRLEGLVRGLVHPTAELSVGEKVGDVDPRGRAVDPTRISDKSLAIAGGVLEILLGNGILPAGGSEIGR